MEHESPLAGDRVAVSDLSPLADPDLDAALRRIAGESRITGRELRERVERVTEHDVAGGAVDRVVSAAALGAVVTSATVG